MNRAILDTSFILACAKGKIDFVENLKFRGIELLIPDEVLNELEKISRDEKKLTVRKQAQLALKMLKIYDFKKISLNMRNVDNGIIAFAKKNPSVIVASLDREIKHKTKNMKLIIRDKNQLEIL